MTENVQERFKPRRTTLGCQTISLGQRGIEDKTIEKLLTIKVKRRQTLICYHGVSVNEDLMLLRFWE